MADPFSIIAGTIGIIDVTSRLVQYLSATAASAAHVNEDLRSLLQEFDAISLVTQSIRDIYTPEVLQSPSSAEKDPNCLEDLKRGTGAILEDCKQTLEKLEKLVKDVIGDSCDIVNFNELKEGQRIDLKRSFRESKFRKKFESFRVQLRKDSRDDEFSRLRAQLHRSQTALQVSFQAIHQWSNETSHTTTERSLDLLLEEVQLLAINLKAQNVALSQDPKPTLGFSNEYFEAPAASNLFTGREALLDEIRNAFVINSVEPADYLTEDTFQKRFVIYGLGGSGKTEFCLKFCENYQRCFWGIFWINAGSNQKAEHDYKRIARYGRIDENTNAAKSWLSSQKLPWLLVIDNADDAEIPINDYIPGGKRGHILITTRNPDLKKYGTVAGGFFHFDGLEEHHAKSLLLKTAEVSSPWQSSVMKHAASITKALGYLPLAVVHAGSAIARGLTTLAEYVDYFEETWEILRSKWRLSGYQENDPEKNVFASYDMLYQNLDKQSDQSSRDAIEMLKLFAFLDFSNIQFDFLAHAAKNPWQREQRALEQDNEKTIESLAHSAPKAAKSWAQRFKSWAFEFLAKNQDYGVLPGVLRDIEALGSFQPTRLREALLELARRSLLTHRRMNGLDIYSMHPLVHKWVRVRPHMRLRERGLWCQAAVTILTQCIALPPLGNKDTERHIRRNLLPHLDSVRERQAEYELELKNEQKKRWVSWMLVITPAMDTKKALQYAKFSRVYMECARFQDAADLQFPVQKHLQNTVGMDHEKTQKITLALSTTLWSLSRFNEALKLQQGVLDSYIKTLGQDHLKTLKLMDLLGKSQVSRGRFKEALKLHETAIEGLKKYLPSDDAAALLRDHPAAEDYFRALANLAHVHRRYFRYEKARDTYTIAVEGLMKALGPKDDDTLFAKEGLAMVNLEIGGDSLRLAQDTMIEVVNQRREKDGPEHGYTLWSIVLLSHVKTALGQGKEVETDMRGAIEIATRIYGAKHFAVLAARAFLANTLIQIQRYSDAENILQDVMDPANYKTGAREEGDHPDRLQAMWFAVESYTIQGKLEEGIRRCEEIADTLQAFGGGQHRLAEKARERKDKLRQKLRTEK